MPMQLRCEECGLPIDAYPCKYCREREASEEQARRAVIAEFSLRTGAPSISTDRASFTAAVAAMERRLEQEKFRGEVKFDPKDILESDRWWYIPYRWIGCMGFIVNKADGSVNWLGSGVCSLSDCFWGHDRGVICGPIDFTFTAEVSPSPETILEIVQYLRPLEFREGDWHLVPDTNGY